MSQRPSPGPPRAYVEFLERFPKIGEAWSLLGEAGASGPLDEKTSRLIKLGISIASRSEGGTHSAVRKALAAGASTDEVFQVVALAASSIGLPQAVAAFTWVREECAKATPAPRRP